MLSAQQLIQSRRNKAGSRAYFSLVLTLCGKSENFLSRTVLLIRSKHFGINLKSRCFRVGCHTQNPVRVLDRAYLVECRNPGSGTRANTRIQCGYFARIEKGALS